MVTFPRRYRCSCSLLGWTPTRQAEMVFPVHPTRTRAIGISHRVPGSVDQRCRTTPASLSLSEYRNGFYYALVVNGQFLVAKPDVQADLGEGDRSKNGRPVVIPAGAPAGGQR